MVASAPTPANLRNCFSIFRKEFLLLADPFEALADVDERRHNRVLGPQDLGHPCSDVRGGDGEGRDVAGVPVILVAGVEDVSEVRLHGRADEGAVVHDLGDVFHAFADLDAVHRGVDGREGAQDLLDVQTLFKGEVTFRIEGVGGRHAARQPDQDAGIGLGAGVDDRGLGVSPDAGSTATKGCHRSCTQLFEEIPARESFLSSHDEIGFFLP